MVNATLLGGDYSLSVIDCSYGHGAASFRWRSILFRFAVRARLTPAISWSSLATVRLASTTAFRLAACITSASSGRRSVAPTTGHHGQESPVMLIPLSLCLAQPPLVPSAPRDIHTFRRIKFASSIEETFLLSVQFEQIGQSVLLKTIFNSPSVDLL